MDRYDLRHACLEGVDTLLNRSWLLSRERVRILKAQRELYATNDTALELLLTIVNRMEQNREGESDMAKKDAKLAYLDHCPDCIPLPTQFPGTCVLELVKALRDPSAIEDPQCAVHCGLTVLCWGAGLWINDHNPPHNGVKATKPPAFKAVPAGTEPKAVDLAKAADELEKAAPPDDPAAPDKKGTVGADVVGALNWSFILAAIIQLLRLIQEQQDL